MASVAVQIIVCVALLASMTPSVQADNRRYDKNREYYRDGLALPIWAIVLITVASVVLLLIFCFCCCAMCQLNEEDKKRGYQNRRHSPKEFIVVMLPGRRDQIYADYESRQQRLQSPLSAQGGGILRKPEDKPLIDDTQPKPIEAAAKPVEAAELAKSQENLKRAQENSPKTSEEAAAPPNANQPPATSTNQAQEEPSKPVNETASPTQETN